MKRITVFRTALGRASPLGREEVIEKRLQVNAVQARVGILSRSDITLRGDWLGGVRC
jgi:hypothetical protein